MLSNISFDFSSYISILEFVICTATSMILGVVIALIHMYKNKYSKHFIQTLVILPAIIQVVIMLVNGNLGTGVAVMGAFSLVRFRSVPGNSREIGSIFFAMAAGLAAGTGYIAIAVLIVVCIGAMMMLLLTLNFGEGKTASKVLKITLPENLNYEGMFDDILTEYTKTYRLVKVRTVNMGSLFELQYEMEMLKDKSEKELIDEVRCRNGNLTVLCGYAESEREEL